MTWNGARWAAMCKNERDIEVPRCGDRRRRSIDLWRFEGPPVVVERDHGPECNPSLKRPKTVSGTKGRGMQLKREPEVVLAVILDSGWTK